MKDFGRMKDCEKYKSLLMGLIDDELTPEEAGEVNAHLIKCRDCRVEYEELRSTAAKIEKASFEEPTDEVLNRLWKRPYHRFMRNSGLFLVVAGYAALIIYALVEMFRSSGEPLFPKITFAAIVIGFAILLANVIRERIHTYRADPYKEVKR